MLSPATLRRLIFFGTSAFIAAGVAHVIFWRRRRQLICLHRRQKQNSTPLTSDTPAPTRLCVDVSRVWIVESCEQWDFICPALEQEISKVKVLSLDCEWKSSKGGRSKVSLLQLSTSSGLVILVRLLFLEDSFPQTLLRILEDRSIIKVGIQIQDDARKLMSDHGIVVRGWMDLRNLALREGVIAIVEGFGLAGLSKEVLNINLNKRSSSTRSNWEADYLSQAQVEYAAADAIVGSFIFTRIVSLRLGGNATTDYEDTIKEMCDGLIEVKTRESIVTIRQQRRNNKESNPVTPAAPSTAVVKNKSRAYEPRKEPMYQNCRLLAPDGQLLCTCDKKKAQWYISKGLADKITFDPFTVQLRFEPAGRPSSSDDSYDCQEKRNICVVCGAGEAYVRKNVVPHDYRKYFPTVMKEHRSHDVLLLCLQCHQQSNVHDFTIKRQLEIDCDAPITTKYNSDHDLKQVVSAAKALQQCTTLPPSRKQELEQIVMKYYGVEKLDDTMDDLLQRALTINTKSPNKDFEPHGQKVVQHVVETVGLVEFEKMWRKHFLATMKPKYLPDLWSVEYQEQDMWDLDEQLQQYLQNGQAGGSGDN